MLSYYPKSNLQNLLGYFTQNPLDISYWAKNSLIRKQTLTGKPWISLPAIKEIEGFLKPDMNVFEYGSGNSTLFFADFPVHITSIESKEDWYNKISESINKKETKAKSIQIHLYAFEEGSRESFANSGYPNSIKRSDNNYDLILIDGEEVTNYSARTMCFYQAEWRIKSGGMIVVDDFWRYESLLNNHRAKDVRIFSGIGPGRRGLTSTAIFYY